MGAASYLSNAPYVTKIAFNLFINRFGTKPFVRLSVNDYFWNFTDPLLIFGRSFAPSLVPEDNMGILNQIYKDFTDVITVYMGVESGPRNFFKITKYNGANGLQSWDNETCDSVEGSSEGVSYHQNVFKNDTVKYLRKTICRALPLYYGGDVEMYGMIGYRFNLPNNSFSRPENENEECYREPGYPLLPSGLSDVSPCYHNLPIASSFPHLMFCRAKSDTKISRPYT
uniref:Scavenger receptor class b member 1-like protein n=1 Tax=Triatoma infestans TaxID=30076 RepID=A0A170YK83_TRIIF